MNNPADLNWALDLAHWRYCPLENPISPICPACSSPLRHNGKDSEANHTFYCGICEIDITADELVIIHFALILPRNIITGEKDNE